MPAAGWYVVEVYFARRGHIPADAFRDAVRARSARAALARASWNWPDAAVRVLAGPVPSSAADAMVAAAYRSPWDVAADAK